MAQKIGLATVELVRRALTQEGGTMTDERLPMWCRFGLHRWQRVGFADMPWVKGRRCRRCRRVQHFWPGLLGIGWVDSNFTPREDADGYY